ncbi:hypothetical protein Mp_3g06630 [Marchantia polymorpha subsp. ruderalis]|uniref:HAT C-terminal dimerisation domain-containing protein n=1 Tax=Marchantia polymorpha subsp. ruderalis TaxID=1480154 RepID=A0AAF6AY30_MARPO|nr:hypothetical protein Mp_3g06630 [Marchantia polymorpha subsp. ruderalis]
MHVFVIIDVYMMMYNLYTTVLNPDAPLELLMPTRVRLGVETAPHEFRRASDLHETTRMARALTLQALSERYFDRYNPIRALQRPHQIYTFRGNKECLGKDVPTAADFKFSYLLEAQCLIEATPIDPLDVPRGWTVQELRAQHHMFVMAHIWTKIKSLAAVIAQSIFVQRVQSAANTPAPLPSAPKRQKTTMNLLASALKLPAGSSSSSSSSTPTTAAQIVADEISVLQSITDPDDWPEPADLCQWYAQKHNQMPCISQVALAVLANKSSSGGLECDLGCMTDVIAPKRSAMRAGMVEINMFLKINKKLMKTNRADDRIPRRPAMALKDVEQDGFDSDDNSSDIEEIGDDDAALC